MIAVLGAHELAGARPEGVPFATEEAIRARLHEAEFSGADIDRFLVEIRADASWTGRVLWAQRTVTAGRLSLVDDAAAIADDAPAADDLFRLRGFIDQQGNTIGWVALELEKLTAPGDRIKGVLSQLIEDAGMASREQWAALLDWLGPEPAAKLEGILKPASIAPFIQLVRAAAGSGALPEGAIELAHQRRVSGASGTPPIVALWQALGYVRVSLGTEGIRRQIENRGHPVTLQELAQLVTALIRGQQLESAEHAILRANAAKFKLHLPLVTALDYLLQMPVADQVWEGQGEIVVPPESAKIGEAIRVHLIHLLRNALHENVEALQIILKYVLANAEFLNLTQNESRILEARAENPLLKETRETQDDWHFLGPVLGKAETLLVKDLLEEGEYSTLREFVSALAGEATVYWGEPIQLRPILTGEQLQQAVTDNLKAIQGAARVLLGYAGGWGLDPRERAELSLLEKAPDDARPADWFKFGSLVGEDRAKKALRWKLDENSFITLHDLAMSLGSSHKTYRGGRIFQKAGGGSGSSRPNLIEAFVEAGFLTQAQASLPGRDIHKLLQTRSAGELVPVLEKVFRGDSDGRAAALRFFSGPFSDTGWKALTGRLGGDPRDSLPESLRRVGRVPEVSGNPFFHLVPVLSRRHDAPDHYPVRSATIPANFAGFPGVTHNGFLHVLFYMAGIRANLGMYPTGRSEVTWDKPVPTGTVVRLRTDTNVDHGASEVIVTMTDVSGRKQFGQAVYVNPPFDLQDSRPVSGVTTWDADLTFGCLSGCAAAGPALAEGLQMKIALNRKDNSLWAVTRLSTKFGAEPMPLFLAADELAAWAGRRATRMWGYTTGTVRTVYQEPDRGERLRVVAKIPDPSRTVWEEGRGTGLDVAVDLIREDGSILETHLTRFIPTRETPVLGFRLLVDEMMEGKIPHTSDVLPFLQDSLKGDSPGAEFDALQADLTALTLLREHGLRVVGRKGNEMEVKTDQDQTGGAFIQDGTLVVVFHRGENEAVVELGSVVKPVPFKRMPREFAPIDVKKMVEEARLVVLLTAVFRFEHVSVKGDKVTAKSSDGRWVNIKRSDNSLLVENKPKHFSVITQDWTQDWAGYAASIPVHAARLDDILVAWQFLQNEVHSAYQNHLLSPLNALLFGRLPFKKEDLPSCLAAIQDLLRSPLADDPTRLAMVENLSKALSEMSEAPLPPSGTPTPGSGGQPKAPVLPAPPAATRHAVAFSMPAASSLSVGAGGLVLDDEDGAVGPKPTKRSMGSLRMNPGNVFGFAHGQGAWGGRSGVFRTPGRLFSGG